MMDIETRLRENSQWIEEKLEQRLDFDILGGKSPMTEAMRYAVLGGGKRIRAFLTVEFAAMFGADREVAADYACALEMVHAYSLVHDDLPCMDDDDMRRGRPSCHKAFGETVALLAGDALLTRALGCAAEHGMDSGRAVAALARCAGAPGMCGGQELDLSLECDSYEELKHLHNLKTGALMEAACLLGYYAAVPQSDTKMEETIRQYALSLGLAFQIEDDLLDVRSTSEVLGKPVGSDEKNGKKTVLTYMSINEAEQEAQRLSQYAAQLFETLPNSEWVSKLPLYLLDRDR